MVTLFDHVKNAMVKRNVNAVRFQMDRLDEILRGKMLIRAVFFPLNCQRNAVDYLDVFFACKSDNVQLNTRFI